MRFHAPYLEWAKKRPAARFDLAGSNISSCTIDDLEGARDALSLTGANDDGYAPLVDAIARRYGVTGDRVVTANGAAGANFQAFAALLEPGDDVLIERPGYDPLMGAVRLLGAKVIRFDRRVDTGYALEPDAIARAITPRTKLVVVTSPHNPTGALADRTALAEIGSIASRAGAYVLVDEVYLDAADPGLHPAALLGEAFISTSSLTKSYGLSSLRCGWSISIPSVAERIRRARDVIDGSGSIAAERLATLAFAQLDRLEVRALALLETNRAIVDDFLRGHPALEVVLPRRSTVIFPRIRGVPDTTTFAERLFAEHGTAVVPGRFFEAPEHFRLGFGGATTAVRGGLERIGLVLDELSTEAS
jgi:aspartate/methionine/tyrosine aminotransferase